MSTCGSVFVCEIVCVCVCVCEIMCVCEWRRSCYVMKYLRPVKTLHRSMLFCACLFLLIMMN